VERYRKTFNQNPPPNPKDRQWLLIFSPTFRLYQEVKAINQTFWCHGF